MQGFTRTAESLPLASSRDVLTDVLRRGAQHLLATAIDAEVAAWIDGHVHCLDAAGRRQVVRNGYMAERTLTTGIGPIAVQQPRVHDRRPKAEAEKFTSRILPPYLRKTKSIEELIPWLYLKGVSTGDFSEALAALLGADAPGLCDGAAANQENQRLRHTPGHADDGLQTHGVRIETLEATQRSQTHRRCDSRSSVQRRHQSGRRLSSPSTGFDNTSAAGILMTRLHGPLQQLHRPVGVLLLFVSDLGLSATLRLAAAAMPAR